MYEVNGNMQMINDKKYHVYRKTLSNRITI